MTFRILVIAQAEANITQKANQKRPKVSNKIQKYIPTGNKAKRIISISNFSDKQE